MRAHVAISMLSILLAAGCGTEIGDECSLDSECSPSGDRICDTSSPGGYCTVQGCTFDTCPEESMCVRFFSVSQTNLPCDPDTEDLSTNDCTPGEICTLTGSCVPRAAETRFCMRKCSGSGDCRERYECRTEELMRLHGGEPVPAPGEALPQDLQAFCAPAPTEL